MKKISGNSRKYFQATYKSMIKKQGPTEMEGKSDHLENANPNIHEITSHQ